VSTAYISTCLSLYLGQQDRSVAKDRDILDSSPSHAEHSLWEWATRIIPRSYTTPSSLRLGSCVNSPRRNKKSCQSALCALFVVDPGTRQGENNTRESVSKNSSIFCQSIWFKFVCFTMHSHLILILFGAVHKAFCWGASELTLTAGT